MKNILNKYIPFLLAFSMTVIITLFASCNNDDGTSSEVPVITEIRNYEASPNDTLIDNARTEQWVVIMGENLSNVTSVTFGGTLAQINTSLITDVSVVVQIPNIRYDSIPNEFHDEVRLVTKDGKVATYNFSNNIIGPPLISKVRNYADSPNDTLVDVIVPGQKINLIGYNLRNVTEISFQGIQIDLANVVFTDSSAVVQVPELEEFKASNLALKNTIKYTTKYSTFFASTTFKIKIDIPIIVDPFLKLLTGGVGPGKTWVLDVDATYFKAALLFAGEDIRWGKECTGTNCFYYEPSNKEPWMPAPGDYGSMTFSVGETGLIVNVNQKVIDTKGIYEGFYALNFEAKTLSFTGIEPLNVGWNNADWSMAYVISLTENTMQLGFHHNGKPELEIYNYIAK